MSKPTMEVDYNGTKTWVLKGKYHREDGPAIEHANGTKWWFLKGKYHREDGPAIEFADGRKWWFLNGTQLSEEVHTYYSVRMGEFLLEFGADL